MAELILTPGNEKVIYDYLVKYKYYLEQLIIQSHKDLIELNELIDKVKK
jgi:hypothetical protein